jgi:hypothetical protein
MRWRTRVRHSPRADREEDVVAGQQTQFVQVIKGHVAQTPDARAEAKAMFDRWASDLAPGSVGWLGTTTGVAEDGTLIAIARFESAEAARSNSNRPEQHQWWMETAKLFSGEVVFHDCTQVEEFLRGGSDDAGFVQVIEGRVLDVERMRRLNQRFMELTDAGKGRSDVIGGLIALYDGDRFVQSVYFRSEAEARAGEAAEMPAEMAALWDEESELLQDLTYLDLKEPWLYSRP